MKRKIVTGSVLTLFIAVFLYFSFDHITPNEIENAPDWMPLEEALTQASLNNSDKLILIDIYETGCRFCRQMEREVYPSETIRTLIDRDFYPVKINGNSEAVIEFLGEPMMEKEFSSKMGVTAFPFTVIMDSSGNVVDRRRGFMGTMDMSRFLNGALEIR
ncbi:MAG: thioredoxin fold domain-containing protein [Balneolaceae bacterium]